MPDQSNTFNKNKRMVEIICINDKFSKNQLEFFNRFSIEIPIKDTLYTIREIVPTANGKGLLLEQLVNPEYWGIL